MPERSELKDWSSVLESWWLNLDYFRIHEFGSKMHIPVNTATHSKPNQVSVPMQPLPTRPCLRPEALRLPNCLLKLKPKTSEFPTQYTLKAQMAKMT